MIKARPFILDKIDSVLWYRGFLDKFFNDYQCLKAIGTFELLLCINSLSYIACVVDTSAFVHTNIPLCRCDTLCITPIEYLLVAEEPSWILRCKTCHCFAMADAIYKNRSININNLFVFMKEIIRQHYYVYCYTDENSECFCNKCIIKKLETKRSNQIIKLLV